MMDVMCRLRSRDGRLDLPRQSSAFAECGMWNVECKAVLPANISLSKAPAFGEYLLNGQCRMSHVACRV